MLNACKGKQSKTDDKSTLIHGRWELSKAFRDDSETQTLVGTFFEFGEDGNMRTNLPVQTEESAPYTLEPNWIKQGGSVPLDYSIKLLSATELVLILDLQGIRFEMIFAKAKANPGPTGDSTTLQ
jgi:hypothetical protein